MGLQLSIIQHGRVEGGPLVVFICGVGMKAEQNLVQVLNSLQQSQCHTNIGRQFPNMKQRTQA